MLHNFFIYIFCVLDTYDCYLKLTNPCNMAACGIVSIYWSNSVAAHTTEFYHGSIPWFAVMFITYIMRLSFFRQASFRSKGLHLQKSLRYMYDVALNFKTQMIVLFYRQYYFEGMFLQWFLLSSGRFVVLVDLSISFTLAEAVSGDQSHQFHPLH